MTSQTDRTDPSEWVTHGERRIYENKWVTVSLVDVELPDGQRFEHHKVSMPSAAMAAVLDDDGRVLLMWRHRFISNTWNWELPGGVVEDGEEPAETIAREIEEELGYHARSLEHVVTFQPMIGTLDSPHHVFIARGADHIGEPTEKTEMQRMEWIPLEQVPTLIQNGEISNSGSLVALLYVLATRDSVPALGGNGK
jgi:8-oxo-dGTP pyrophosphatase MutT (NUDIX family)